MPAILLVDDRDDQRRTVALAIRRALRRRQSPWTLVDAAPLEALEAYTELMIDSDSAALLLDERLRESAQGQESPVEYEGHDLADYVRSRYPTLPIYVVTAYPDDDDLRERFGKVEAILRRDDFVEHVEAYTERILRAASRYYEENEANLSRLSELADKQATTALTADESSELAAIQARMSIPFPVASPGRPELLDALEGKLNEIDALEAELRAHLGLPST